MKGGPCGLIASVQAIVLKHLLYGDVNCLNNARLRPTKSEITQALVEAITEILWKAGNSKQATLVLSLGSISPVIVANGLGFKQFTNQLELKKTINSNINQVMFVIYLVSSQR